MPKKKKGKKFDALKQSASSLISKLRSLFKRGNLSNKKQDPSIISNPEPPKPAKVKRIRPSKFKLQMEKLYNWWRSDKVKSDYKQFAGDSAIVVAYGVLGYFAVYSWFNFGSMHPLTILGYGATYYLFLDLTKHLADSFRRRFQ